MDEFAWCTWDAFYSQVAPGGVLRGLRSLRAAGTPARTLILDDGWQAVTPPEAASPEAAAAATADNGGGGEGSSGKGGGGEGGKCREKRRFEQGHTHRVRARLHSPTYSLTEIETSHKTFISTYAHTYRTRTRLANQICANNTGPKHAHGKHYDAASPAVPWRPRP